MIDINNFKEQNTYEEYLEMGCSPELAKRLEDFIIIKPDFPLERAKRKAKIKVSTDSDIV